MRIEPQLELREPARGLRHVGQHQVGLVAERREVCGTEAGRHKQLIAAQDLPLADQLLDVEDVFVRDRQTLEHEWLAVEIHRLVERSEEHTSELQSHSDLVCRLLLEKKKKK